jgi:hypothetical protein
VRGYQETIQLSGAYATRQASLKKEKEKEKKKKEGG